MRNYPTNKIVYSHIDEIWIIDSADFSDYRSPNNKGFRYIFILFDNISQYFWCVPLKIKNSKTITEEFSNILSQNNHHSKNRKRSRSGIL